MTAANFVTDIAGRLDSWNVSYEHTLEGIYTSTVSCKVSDDNPPYVATITYGPGDDVIGMTSDADRAAALIAWPLYRAAWEAGYCGDVDVDTYPDTSEVELTFHYGSDSVTILADNDWAPGDDFTISSHPLLPDTVNMSDLPAALESTDLTYQYTEEAWEVLCGASDYEACDWVVIVETLNGGARFTEGPRFTLVEARSDSPALVGWRDPDSPARVINVALADESACWSHQEVAAAVLAIIP